MCGCCGKGMMSHLLMLLGLSKPIFDHIVFVEVLAWNAYDQREVTTYFPFDEEVFVFTHLKMKLALAHAEL